MKHEATSSTWAGALLLLAVGGGAFGCTAYSTYKTLPPGCDVEAAFDLQAINAFEMVGVAGTFWTASDTPDAGLVPSPPPYTYVASTVEAISDGPHCGSTAALVMRSERNNDWGSLFGIDIGAPRNASDYDGLSFWARAPGNTTNAFTVLFNDPNTAVPEMGGEPKCKDYGLDGGTGQTQVDGTGMVIMGSVADAPEPDQCGNSYAAVQVVTADWRFYTIPFGAFQQVATPNRVPNAALTEVGPEPGTALLTSSLLSLTFRMPKAATMQLWIDNLSFYRKPTGTVGGGDGGVDAAQM